MCVCVLCNKIGFKEAHQDTLKHITPPQTPTQTHTNAHTPPDATHNTTANNIIDDCLRAWLLLVQCSQVKGVR